MSWSTNWPTKVNPDVSAGLGFSPRESLWSLLAMTWTPSFMTGWPVSGSVRGLPMIGFSSMVAPRLAEQRHPTAGCGGWLLNMNPKRPSVVGLLTTRSMPRSSAPWGGVGGSSSATALGSPPGVSPAAVAAVPSPTAAVPLMKPRRLIPRDSFA